MPRSLYGDVDAISVKRSPEYMYICGQNSREHMKLIGQVLGVSYCLGSVIKIFKFNTSLHTEGWVGVGGCV
jgi:hypothetical protein